MKRISRLLARFAVVALAVCLVQGTSLGWGEPAPVPILKPSLAPEQSREASPPTVLPPVAKPSADGKAPSASTHPAPETKPPASKPADRKCEPEKKKEEPKSFWELFPIVRPLPPPGNWPVRPKGPGYYSLLDVFQHECREKPPKFPYSAVSPIFNSFFDADFRYLEDPKNKQTDPFDCLKRIHCGDCWMFSTGGEFRYRYMNVEHSQLTRFHNDYDLFRTRVYGDLWYGDRLRAYVEMIDARIANNELPPALIDVNKTDLLNAFIDLKVMEIDNRPVYGRIGRQEMLLGSQRLISPLDWANTRRTFQGGRFFYEGEKTDVDVFWVQPVVPHPSHFDSVNNDRNFAGIWTTHRPEKGQYLDLYYLFLDDTRHYKLLGVPLGPFNVHTLGCRVAGDKNHYLWDGEVMMQFGRNGGRDSAAAATSLGGGYNFSDACLNPTVWVYYDYASGDNTPNAGDNFTTFNQLFPFGHYYLGWADLVGRQNIHDLNAHLFLYPTKWITVWMQYHRFWLAASRDALYNAAGVPIRRDPTGLAGTDVGNEVDITFNFHLGPHSDILTGYSHLFAGSFLERTGAGYGSGLYYLQYSFRW